MDNSKGRMDRLHKHQRKHISILVEPWEPTPVPYARWVIRILKLLSICPCSYDGSEFIAQKKPLYPVLYMCLITILISITLGFLITHEEPQGHIPEPLIKIVRYANLSTNLIFNSVAIWTIVRNRHLAVKCLNYVHHLWQIYCPKKEHATCTAFGVILLVIDTVLTYAIHVVRLFFPLIEIMHLTGIPPNQWEHHVIKAFVAIIVYWPQMCFNAVGVSVLLWLILIYGSTYACIMCLEADAKEVSREDRVDRTNAKWIQVNRVRDAVSALDSIFQTAGIVYSVRLFCFFIDFGTRAMEELLIIAETDPRAVLEDRILRAILLTNESIFLIIAMQAISLCALKVNDTYRILAENPSSLRAYDLKGIYKKLRHMRVQPSAMGYYKVDLQTLVGMTGSIITYTVVIIQFTGITTESNGRTNVAID